MKHELDDSRHVVLSGCSGGGKSALLTELADRGFPTVPEPGRSIVEEELRGEGRALPWVDLAAFARRAIEIASNDRRAMKFVSNWVFFDRGLIDATTALRHASRNRMVDFLDASERYHRRVFMAPPWPEIFTTDRARRQGLGEAIAEYDRLLAAYSELGYETILLPKVDVSERADFVLRHFR